MTLLQSKQTKPYDTTATLTFELLLHMYLFCKVQTVVYLYKKISKYSPDTTGYQPVQQHTALFLSKKEIKTTQTTKTT